MNYIIDNCKLKYDYLLSTISPQNTASLSLAFSCGQNIVLFSEIYNVPRFLMFKNLKNDVVLELNSLLQIPRENIYEIKQLNNTRYIGYSFNNTKQKICFKKVIVNEKIRN